MKFLVCIDGSEHSTKVIEKATKYAGSLNGEITLLYVLEEFLRYPPYVTHFTEDSLKKLRRDLKEATDEMMDKWERVLKEKGIPVIRKVKSTLGSPANAICEIAKEEDYDLIILGNRGLGGLKKLFLGSVSLKVANSCQTNVMIVK